MDVLEFFEKAQQIVPEGATIELWSQEDKVALVIRCKGSGVKRVWDVEVLKQCVGLASPEKMMLECAEQMAVALEKTMGE